MTADVDGDKIGPVVRNGRPDKGMPPFDRTDQQIASLAAFIHTQQNNALQPVAERQRRTQRSRRFGSSNRKCRSWQEIFQGAGGCSSCHSPTGDLAGIASRYQGLELEEQMLYPKHAKSKVTVTLSSGRDDHGHTGLSRRVYGWADRF